MKAVRSNRVEDVNEKTEDLSQKPKTTTTVLSLGNMESIKEVSRYV